MATTVEPISQLDSLRYFRLQSPSLPAFQTNKMAAIQSTFVVLILAVLLLAINTVTAYPAYGEYYNGIQGPYYNPYGAISGNYGGSSWDSSVVNHVFF